MPDLFAELEWRGFVHHATQEIATHLSAERRTVYCGFDPTAPSLHDRHEIAELQAGRGRIEPAVYGAALRAEVRRDFLRGVVHGPAPLELSDELRHAAQSY